MKDLTAPADWYQRLTQNAEEELIRVQTLHPSFRYSPNLFGTGPTWWGWVTPENVPYHIEVRCLDQRLAPHPNRPHVFVPFLFPRLTNPHHLHDYSLCLDYLLGPAAERWQPEDGILTLVNWTCFWLFSYAYWVRSASVESDRIWLYPSI